MDESSQINIFDKWITEREASVLNLGIDLPPLPPENTEFPTFTTIANRLNRLESVLHTKQLPMDLALHHEQLLKGEDFVGNTIFLEQNRARLSETVERVIRERPGTFIDQRVLDGTDSITDIVRELSLSQGIHMDDDSQQNLGEAFLKDEDGRNESGLRSEGSESHYRSPPMAISQGVRRPLKYRRDDSPTYQQGAAFLHPNGTLQFADDTLVTPPAVRSDIQRQDENVYSQPFRHGNTGFAVRSPDFYVPQCGATPNTTQQPAWAAGSEMWSKVPYSPTVNQPLGLQSIPPHDPQVKGGPYPGRGYSSYGMNVPQSGLSGREMFPHYIHVPIFRSKKKVYVKKQSEGCVGCLNSDGLFDRPGGLLGFFNLGGCLDRDMVVKVDRCGNVIRRKK